MINVMIFYTYLWLREDGTPYYAGKGTKRRAYTQHTHRLKLPQRHRIIVQEHIDEQSALEAERFLIEFYGREIDGSGCLLNYSLGGEETANRKGVRFSDEHKQKISIALRGNKNGIGNRSISGRQLPPSTRRKISLANKGRTVSAENRLKLRAVNLGNKHCLGRNVSEETKLKIKQSRSWYRQHSPETIQRLRDAWVRRKSRATGNSV